MPTRKKSTNKNTSRGLALGALSILLLATIAFPLYAQSMREFAPIPRTELYERDFLNDFYATLGYRPDSLTWVDESATVNLLVTAAVQAERGDSEAALLTCDMLPDHIASAFPFLTTMNEDLGVPEILTPWYDFDQAREMLFSFYTDVWLPHPEYRDDYISFKDDTIGRASRRDPAVPAVWILGHLADYGFVQDQALSDDDPYLFLWDLLSGITYYAQRATYYGLDWERYREYDYRLAVVRKVASLIRAAHEEASRKEVGRGFWADLIDSRHPFESQTEGTQSTGVVEPSGTSPFSLEGTSQPGPSTESTTETAEESITGLFEMPQPVSQESEDERYDELELRIEDLAAEVGVPIEEEPTEETQPVEEITAPEVTEEIPEVTEETTAPATGETSPTFNVPELGPEVGTPGTETPAVEETTEETPVEATEEIPDEFMAEAGPDRQPSELQPEAQPPGELGNYATVRLEEIADQLSLDIGGLADDLGRETIDLVVLYNDVNVTEDTIVNAEDRYVAKREAFLAGVAVWDRFNMEIFTPLTLADFNDLVVSDLNAPLNQLRANSAQWAQYRAYDSHFEEAFGQIEMGVRNRRGEPDVLAAESAALTRFLGDYNDLIKEIEDLLSGAITEPPAETESPE